MQTITIQPADLAVGDVIYLLGTPHVVAAVRWEGGNRVWTSSHATDWRGKPAEYAIHRAIVNQAIRVERAA